MINRPFWVSKIENYWKLRSIVWLSGVRRSGKTTISRMIKNSIYLNCDLPSTAQKLENPEMFFKTCPQGDKIIFDEIHRLPDPSMILKIAADEYPTLKILATGSSTLSAAKKFRDTLTGRKITVYLSPILWSECLGDFSVKDLDQRLLRGGLPETMLSENNFIFYSEWLDSFYARDILELFSIRERTGFISLLKIMIRQSGGISDYTALSGECGVSRITVKSYLEAMSVAHAIFPLYPFHGNSRRELVSRPKIYAFDTGFVCYVKGAEKIRDEDRGYLWEHLVLDSLRAVKDYSKIGYWRDKSGREIDFTVAKNDSVDVYECKINPDRFDVSSLSFFRNLYPGGKNFLVCPGVSEPYDISVKNMLIRVINCQHIEKES